MSLQIASIVAAVAPKMIGPDTTLGGEFMSSTARRTFLVASASLAVAVAVPLTAGCSSTSPTTAGPAVTATARPAGGGKQATTGSTLATKEIGGYRFDVVSAEVMNADAGLLPPDR